MSNIANIDDGPINTSVVVGNLTDALHRTRSRLSESLHTFSHKLRRGLRPRWKPKDYQDRASNNPSDALVRLILELFNQSKPTTTSGPMIPSSD